MVDKEPTKFGKSTWRNDTNRSSWTHHHWLIQILGLHPTDLDKNIPVHAKDDQMAWIPQLTMHKWILTHAAWPLILHQLYTWYTHKALHPFAAFILYTVAFKANAILQLHFLRRLGHQHGFLDGDKHERDQIPDDSVGKVMHSLTLTSTIRPLVTVFLAYRRSTTPLNSISWLLLPIELGLYAVILDFYFYWYHRFMHTNPTLWRYHRTHHLTKHPNPLLTLFADSEQEFFDILVIPLMTYGTLKLLGFPMTFADWWICHQYIVFVELFGHSGVRVFSVPPNPVTPVLQYFDCELIVEDHDLHHRKGWKDSYNYGKQTRLWDRVFGTLTPRIESLPENVDWGNKITLPLL